MPSPSSSLATLRPDLAESFQEFDLAAEQQGFIALDVLPVIEVDRQAGNFGRIPAAQLLANRDTQRANRGGYSRGNFTFEEQTYACKEFGAEEPVDNREEQMFRNFFDAEQLAAFRAFDAVLRNHEITVAALVQNTSTFSNTGVSNGAWSGGSASSATPIADVEAAVQALWGNSGIWANALILERHAFRNLRNIPEIVDRLKYCGLYDPTAKSISASVLQQVFDVEKVLVAGTAKNSANEGQTAAFAPIWDKTKAVVCRINTSADFRQPGIGRTWHWGSDGSSIGGTVESYRDETIRADVIRCRHDVDPMIIYSNAGYIITGVQ